MLIIIIVKFFFILIFLEIFQIFKKIKIKFYKIKNKTNGELIFVKLTFSISI